MFEALARLEFLGKLGASFIAILILFPLVWSYAVAREFLNFCNPPGRPLHLPEWARRVLAVPHVGMCGPDDFANEKPPGP